MSCLDNKNLYQKLITWSLIVAVFVLMLLPIQIHVHHELGLDSLYSNGHAIHYHMMIDDIDHAPKGQIHTIEIVSDFIIKQSSDNLFKATAFIILFLLVTLQIFSYYQLRFHSIEINYQKYYILSPPLRAPPF